jgi:hypothetical protein
MNMEDYLKLLHEMNKENTRRQLNTPADDHEDKPDKSNSPPTAES